MTTLAPALPRRRGARFGATLGLALRNLTAERRRWGVSSIALGIAAMLVLFIQGTVRWIDDSATAYLRHTPAQMVATQTGVDDLLFSQATIAPQLAVQVRAIAGVQSVTPIMAFNGVLSGRATPLPLFLIGYQPGGAGGPWHLTEGRAPQGAGEVALDRSLAFTNGIHLGDSALVLGRRLHVVGITADTNAAGIFFGFVSLPTAQAIAGSPIYSDLLVSLKPGADAGQVAASIDRISPAAMHTLTVDRMAANDRGMVDAGFAQPIEIFLVICLAVGLLIAAIVLYTATVEHARDFAVLKAVGARARVLTGVAVIQSLALSLCGFAIGWVLATAVTEAFRTFRPVLDANIDMDIVGEMFAAVVIVNLLALVLPLRFLRRVDPQEVFKA